MGTLSGGSISNSYATGNTFGFVDLGGFVGSISGAKFYSTILGSYSRVRVVIKSDADSGYSGYTFLGNTSRASIGGFVGSLGGGSRIARCYSTGGFRGVIGGRTKAGSFLGELISGTVTSSFYDVDKFISIPSIASGNLALLDILDLETYDMQEDWDSPLSDIRGLGSAFEYNQGKYPRVRLKGSTEPELVPGQEDLP